MPTPISSPHWLLKCWLVEELPSQSYEKKDDRPAVSAKWGQRVQPPPREPAVNIFQLEEKWLRAQHWTHQWGMGRGVGCHMKTTPFFMPTEIFAKPHPEKGGLLGNMTEVHTKSSCREGTIVVSTNKECVFARAPHGQGQLPAEEQTGPWLGLLIQWGAHSYLLSQVPRSAFRGCSSEISSMWVMISYILHGWLWPLEITESYPELQQQKVNKTLMDGHAWGTIWYPKMRTFKKKISKTIFSLGWKAGSVGNF